MTVQGKGVIVGDYLFVIADIVTAACMIDSISNGVAIKFSAHACMLCPSKIERYGVTAI